MCEKMEIYVQSIKNMYMIIVPPGEINVPRYEALCLVQLGLTTEWGADILLWSKEAAKMNTETLDW